MSHIEKVNFDATQENDGDPNSTHGNKRAETPRVPPTREDEVVNITNPEGNSTNDKRNLNSGMEMSFGPGPINHTSQSGKNSRPSTLELQMSPLVNFGGSSPEFELGDTTPKRRRIKKKDRRGHTRNKTFSLEHKQLENHAPSIDLNRAMAESESMNHEKRSSPAQSVIELEKQVGFQIDMGISFMNGILKGGGGKTGNP
ncbi:hypothetical protein LXL04_018891 [Taraxacum kok-saghyz]